MEAANSTVGCSGATPEPDLHVEARRQATSLVHCAQFLQSQQDAANALASLANCARELLCCELAMVLVRQGEEFVVVHVAAGDPNLKQVVNTAWEEGSRFTWEVAKGALSAAQPWVVSIKGDEADLPAYLAAGQLMAAAITAEQTSAVLLIWGQQRFQQQDQALLAALGAMGSLAISRIEQHSMASARSRELQQLLEAFSPLDLPSSHRIPQFSETLAHKAAEIVGARASALVLVRGQQPGTSFLHEGAGLGDPVLWRRLTVALGELAQRQPEMVLSGAAAEFLGTELANDLGWCDLALARLTGSGGEVIGWLCLADCGRELGTLDRSLLQALAGHAAVALENARLFAQMEQANRHWVEIFDAITDFIVVHDETYRVLRVNRSLADFMGVKPAQLIGVSMRALGAMAGDNGTHQCPFCRAGTEGVDEYVHPLLQYTYLITTSRMSGGPNEGYQCIHVLKDISDRREAERRYRELFDNIQEGLFFSTPEGRFIEVNDALVRMLGYGDRDELLQSDITSHLYPSPAQRERFMREIEKEGILRNYEETLRRRDGSLIHTLQNAFAVRDSQGKVIQYRGLMLDITEQKNFQVELQRQRDFNNKVLNNTQNMILVVDPAGLISYANRRCFEAGGYRQEDLLGRRLVDLVPPGRRQALLDALDHALGGGQVDHLELPILLGQGRGGQFAINMSPMRDEPSHVSSIVVVMTDITDAAMLQAKLMHTEKMAAVGQLVSGVAHEVNNPLTAILGFSDLLLEQPDVPDTAKKDLRIIMQEAQRTKQIVQNLLSFARQTPPQRMPVQLNAIVRRTLALRSYDLNNHGVKVIERLHDHVPEVVGDSHQLQQVFLNILNNAYDAVREAGRQGRIEVSTSFTDQFVEIAFRDNGPGVVYPERIFDPFFTTKDVGKGTGLGLSICYGIVREHGGEIFCRNNGDEPGATFTVRLPLMTAEAAAAAAAAATSAPGVNP